MTSVQLEHITKRYGQVAAVDSVDLAITPGEVFFILGPSGCGKTTLLRTIAGLTRPTSGRILFNKQDQSTLSPSQRNVGMVFQTPALWPHMTAEQNVAFALAGRGSGLRKKERKERVAKALHMVRMADFARRRPHKLSGGEQQRIALACALALEPAVLLLDEPLNSLDAQLRSDMRSEMKQICQEACITSLFVTHDQREALSMADRVALMRDGKIVQIGSPSEIYDRPATRFAASFLGETNLIPAVVAGAANGAVRLDTAIGELLSAAGLHGTPTGGNVTCSIRPESVQLAKNSCTINAINGKIAGVVQVGETVQYHIDVNQDLTLKALQLSLEEPLSPGTPVALNVALDDVVILTD